MLLRDTDDGPEVFMMKRAVGAAFAGGLYVFPGGVVDQADGSSDVAELCNGLTDAEACRQLGLAHGGLAFWVAAIRECFEEAGVLLATDADGKTVVFDDSSEERFSNHQKAVHDREVRLVEVCQAESLRLETDTIEYVAHWITPRVESRRFDTRFFVTRTPAGQHALHDDVELVDSTWIAPVDALRRHHDGELLMLPPTVAALEFLASHQDVSKAMAAARAIEHPPAIQPVALMDDGKLVGLLLPGDDGYDEALAAEAVAYGEA